MAMRGIAGSVRPLLDSQSFPSVDPRVGWVMTILLLLIALLLTLGVLRIQIGPVPSAPWLAIVCAQVVTAVAVASAAHLSQRRRRKKTEGAEQATGDAAS